MTGVVCRGSQVFLYYASVYNLHQMVFLLSIVPISVFPCNNHNMLIIRAE